MTEDGEQHTEDQPPSGRPQSSDLRPPSSDFRPPSSSPSPAPKRRAAYEQRRVAFAAAFCRLGQASAAYRECFPASKQWKPANVAKEAARLVRDPIVEGEIARITADARLDAIAGRQEIAQTIVDIMRGTLTESRTVTHKRADGSTCTEVVEVPPSLTVRLRAAKDLERMLPNVLPKTPAEQQENEASDSFDATLSEIRKRRNSHAQKERQVGIETLL